MSNQGAYQAGISTPAGPGGDNLYSTPTTQPAYPAEGTNSRGDPINGEQLLYWINVVAAGAAQAQKESYGRAADDPKVQNPNQTPNITGGTGIGYKRNAYQRLEQEMLWQEAMWSASGDTTTTTTSSSSSSNQNPYQRFQEWVHQHLPTQMPQVQLSPPQIVIPVLVITTVVVLFAPELIALPVLAVA